VGVLAVTDSDQVGAGAYFDLAVILSAAGPGALRELIRADYWACPVSREVAP